MKKQALVLGSLIILIGSALMISCKKEGATTTTPATTPLTISQVLSNSYSPAAVASGEFTPESPLNNALENLKWTYFIDNHMCDTVNHTPVTIHLPSNYSNNNTRVFIIGSDRKTGYMNYSSASAGFINYFYLLPANEPWKVLAVAVDNNKYYYALQSATINTSAAENNITVNALNEVSQDDLVKLINGL